MRGYVVFLVFLVFSGAVEAGSWRWYQVEFLSPWSQEVISKSGRADVRFSGDKVVVHFLDWDRASEFHGVIDGSGRVLGVEKGFDPDGYPQKYNGILIRSKVGLPEDVVVKDRSKYVGCFNRSIVMGVASGGGQSIVLTELSDCAKSILMLPIKSE